MKVTFSGGCKKEHAPGRGAAGTSRSTPDTARKAPAEGEIVGATGPDRSPGSGFGCWSGCRFAGLPVEGIWRGRNPGPDKMTDPWRDDEFRPTRDQTVKRATPWHVLADRSMAYGAVIETRIRLASGFQQVGHFGGRNGRLSFPLNPLRQNIISH
jgi:hypothetical protein